ncbi:hypothetical protein PHYSODRAFT_324243 [Phytophthora sojae]|uniref:Uncharacterized protein n=1 Tax=Phytophthora sojae (strain P6497) TaxID=1094619 RepID=G4YSG0_PHYSP|nr:hypothetical protein PHYSODRAFT_324243 [Phytophthora sojae]EGZ22976.1 hypothetical protein PHYSODRAFT_324243 [Phytophthora sojae]|eukprot:XP_009518264.1 hypothetical protein PHYSODRAFT_324243 [Phytophthora sojae]
MTITLIPHSSVALHSAICLASRTHKPGAAKMNWMTSGRHRALYSQRGRRRQMHFPSQVQHQRVRPTSPVRSSQPARARDSTTPWYILPVGDDEESQGLVKCTCLVSVGYTQLLTSATDIRVLELERKGAMRAAEAEDATDPRTEEAAQERPRGVSETSGARPSPTQERSRAQQEEAVQDEGRSETRCIFTPIKKARKYDQLPSAVVQRIKPGAGKRPPSSIASGVDMLFFK